ncbi:hypothetical protein NEOC84_000460|nr:hypothetical protein [Neochlamydia sp. AcF95]NGY94577.1 hypothetical protein [Neochlamydia sp. AcF84]
MDQAAGHKAKNKHLTYRRAVKCTILNELNFVSRALYLYSEYFKDNPLDHLLGRHLLPGQIGKNVFN